MFLAGTLVTLLLAGCWLYCLTDAALTPRPEFPGLRKRTWVVFIALAFALGAVAWLLTRPARRRQRGRRTPSGPGARPPKPGQARAAARSRSGPTGPVGPDDDPEFLQRLDRVIRDGREPGELLIRGVSGATRHFKSD